jgi:hypothetical protein
MKYLMYGLPVSEGYDWKLDPKDYRKDGHIPPNRCYHCGIRFVGAAWAAFCNVCDSEMSPVHEELYFVVTKNDKDAKPPVHEGYWTTRRKIVQNRIRIPDDVLSEEDYKKKLSGMDSNFKNATDLV